ncbi:hypothetical protein ACIBPB_33360 [Micromonospora sp. NPDC049836]|uniref:hypothetical protein n=1 Tax=Micromonospora sp. NPDC049836 TaxID=3364274 RepID=UPI00379DB447
MTKSPVNVAAQQRMTPDDYAVTAIAGDFAERGPLAFESFLSGYYAESIRIIHEAHLTDCTARHGDPCATCDAVRAGLTGIRAEQRATAPRAAS